MVIAEHQVKLTDIHDFISQIPSFPISVAGLIEIGYKKRVDQEVISFYKAFPENVVFKDKEDLVASTEIIQIMHTEDSPAEDEVRGAED